MSEFHKTHSKTLKVHGTMQSYVIGFIVSLVLTINAYFLVVSKTLTGTTLLATILVFAVLQMATQVFFFLHLGRGPKPLYNVVFFVGTVGLILVVVLGTIFINNNLHYNMSSSDITTRLSESEAIAQVNGVKTGACEQIRVHHEVSINNGVVSPFSTTAHRCDTLTFINHDSTARDIAFGPHPQHQIYGGQTELSVPKGYAKTITLNQLGTYSFHDHLDPKITGIFTVTP